MSQVIVADRKYTCDLNRRSVVTSSRGQAARAWHVGFILHTRGIVVLIKLVMIVLLSVEDINLI